ncbi:MAG: serine hydrolase, partial [Chloroflexota bacterium]
FKGAGGDWIKGFFAVPVLHKPGTHFVYNTGATYMLSAIVQKLTGMMLTDYLEPRLFAPLGIEKAWWEVSPQGVNMGGFGLNIKTEDIARFGQLYLQKGVWQGQQLVPEAWVKEATSIQSDNSEMTNIDWKQGYGYQFWRSRHNAYRGDGAFGQYCVVMPDQDAVLAITSGLGDMQQPMNLVWDILLPAMKDDSLPDDAAAQDRLIKKLSGLNIPPVQGETSSPTAAKVSGRVYKLDANELGFETAALNFADNGCTATIKKGTTEETIRCDYGVWQADETSLLNRPNDKSQSHIVSSGAWTAEDTFTMVVRVHETPFFQTFAFHFADEQMTIETKVNVSFEPPAVEVIAGHPL